VSQSLVMGAYGSKKKQHALLEQEEGIGELPTYEAAKLASRSSPDVRRRNTFGVPEDVIGVIAVHVSRNDIRGLGMMARTCKTWRRILSAKEFVWRTIASDRGMRIYSGTSVRMQVLFGIGVVLQKSFRFMPFEQYEQFPNDKNRRRGHEHVRIGFMALGPYEAGRVGLSSLLVRHTKNEFSEAYNPQLDGWCRRTSLRDSTGESVWLEVLDISGPCCEDPMLMGEIIRYSNVVVLCDPFEKADCLLQLRETMQRIVSLKENENNFPVVIVRTKSDLQFPFPAKTEVLKFCQERKLPFLNASAKECINVKEVVQVAVFAAILNFVR
jgi:hypothetical protein